MFCYTHNLLPLCFRRSLKNREKNAITQLHTPHAPPPPCVCSHTVSACPLPPTLTCLSLLSSTQLLVLYSQPAKHPPPHSQPNPSSNRVCCLFGRGKSQPGCPSACAAPFVPPHFSVYVVHPPRSYLRPLIEEIYILAAFFQPGESDGKKRKKKHAPTIRPLPTLLAFCVVCLLTPHRGHSLSLLPHNPYTGQFTTTPLPSRKDGLRRFRPCRAERPAGPRWPLGRHPAATAAV